MKTGQRPVKLSGADFLSERRRYTEPTESLLSLSQAREDGVGCNDGVDKLELWALGPTIKARAGYNRKRPQVKGRLTFVELII